MVVEVLDPSTAPLWLNIMIWMGVFWEYILVAFIPGFYIAITWLFGFPLLQRWQQEVVIMLFPTKVKFGKITQQYEPYFKSKKGVYWLSNPLQPVDHTSLPEKVEVRMAKIQAKYEKLMEKEQKTKEDEAKIKKLLQIQMKLSRKALTITPRNQVHVYTHAINQSVYRMERRDSKIDEILHNDPRPRKMSGHNIWIMQNPKAHFHRHYQLIIDPSGTVYTLIPVKERQQFSIGFWHSLGVIIQKEVEVTEESEVEGGGGNGKKLIQTAITTHVVIKQMKEVQDYQNFSATRAYQLLKRRARIEENFYFWVTGSMNPIVWVVLIGAIAAIGMIVFFSYNGSQAVGPPPT